MEKTRIHWLNFLSLKSEVNFTFNSGAAQARNDLALIPSFTFQKLIPFKDTIEKCKLLMALQYFGEEKKKDWRVYFDSCDTFWVNNPNICVPKTTVVGVRTPREGWTQLLRRKQLLMSLYVCIFLLVFRRFIYFPAFGCTGSTQVQTTLSPTIHSETGVTGSHSVNCPNGAVCLCSPSMALALMYSPSFFYLLFAQSWTALYTEQ